MTLIEAVAVMVFIFSLTGMVGIEQEAEFCLLCFDYQSDKVVKLVPEVEVIDQEGEP